MRRRGLRNVALTEREWELVLWCVDSFDFNPSDRRAADLMGKIKAQTGLTKLSDGRSEYRGRVRKIGEKVNWLKDPEGEQRAGELARTAISTYLREAGFEVEEAGPLAKFEGARPGYKRLVGPWLPVDQV